jgi:hypothetical protein
MTLTRATYTETSAHATFTIRSDHPLTVNTDQFVIHVDDGEVGIDKPRTSTLPPGTNTITIDATNTGSEPRGIGWIAGDGAQWIRP